MKDSMKSNAVDTAHRIQQNVKNMPITSIAIVGLLGAGAVAWLASCKSSSHCDI